MTVTITIPDAADLQQFERLVAQCFNVKWRDWPPAEYLLGPEDTRIVRIGSDVVGGLKMYPMGQWFGGQRVPMAGVAGVAIAPHHRGSGVAAELLIQTLRELHAQQVPLSTLYAATQKLYRKVGYEQAGVFCQFSLPVSSLVPRDRSLAVTAVDPADWQQFQGMYQRRAIAHNGNLDRHPLLWRRVGEATQRDLYAYRFGAEADPEGYLVFHQESAPGGYHLHLRDLVLLTPAAVQRFWGLMADHRSIGQRVYWCGPTRDPLLTRVDEQTYTVESLSRWFMRMVHVPQALALRGYPPGIETELHLEIQDSVIPENQGRWILQVAQGRGQVQPGGRGELQTTAQGLAPLYSGLVTPQQLQMVGLLDCQGESGAIAALLFNGPEPWLADHF